MPDHIDELARALSRFPGVGPRQGKRFVYHLLAAPRADREKLATLITSLDTHVHQCPECLRFTTDNTAGTCRYCADPARDDTVLMLVEKDQDLAAVERAGTYRGRYFVLGGVLTLSAGDAAIRLSPPLVASDATTVRAVLNDAVPARYLDPAAGPSAAEQAALDRRLAALPGGHPRREQRPRAGRRLDHHQPQGQA